MVVDHPHAAIVEVSGVRRRVDLGLLIDDLPEPGEWVLIHVGFAMSRIDARQAALQMQMLYSLGEAEAAVEEIRGLESEQSDTMGPPA
jgi:hydrogenase expression/formation protein HypC